MGHKNRIILFTFLITQFYFVFTKQPESEMIKTGSDQFWLQITYSLLIVLFAGLMSGLTVGYNSIDPLQLELTLYSAGESVEKKHAKRIYEVIKNRHLLLSTLLLANAVAMEALPIFLNKLMSEINAVIVSTTVVLVFGEILPQAICLGSNQLKIAATMAPVIKVLMILLWPICYPISKFLDYLLGVEEHKVRFGKGQLKALIQLHNKEEHIEGFTDEEITIIHSIIDIRNHNVNKILVPFKNIFCLKNTDKITDNLILNIQKRNYSQIPIVNENGNIDGFLRTKKLLTMYKHIGETIGRYNVHTKPIIIAQNTNLLEVLLFMKESQSQVVIVQKKNVDRQKSVYQYKSYNKLLGNRKENSQILGLVFLRDIFEEMTKCSIFEDELHYHSVKNMMNNKIKSDHLKVNQDFDINEDPFIDNDEEETQNLINKQQ